jgi:hypothetical protein
LRSHAKSGTESDPDRTGPGTIAAGTDREGRLTMQFVTDDDELCLGVILDREHPDLDLSRNDLGNRCLDLAVQGMVDAHRFASAPDGSPWAPLKRSTVRRKGHPVIGVETGRTGLLNPRLYQSAPRDLTAREAWWIFPLGDTRDIAAGWQRGTGRSPARRLIGWTREAQDQARRLIAQAEADLRCGENR